MKKIEYYINIIHYIIYKTDFQFHKWFEKINPIMLVNKLPFQKRMYQRKGIDIHKELDETFANPKFGISSIRSGGLIGILGVLVGGTIYFLVQGFYGDDLNPLFGFLFMAPILGFIYYSVLHKDKYLQYFKEFDKKTMQWKKKWMWMTLCIILFVILSFIGSICLCTYMLN